jgi:hypothetical protein
MLRGCLARFLTQRDALAALVPPLAFSQLRLWSSGGGRGAVDVGGAPPLKAALKSLFLRVHPDLFSEWPAEQVGNPRRPAPLAAAQPGPRSQGRAARFATSLPARPTPPACLLPPNPPRRRTTHKPKAENQRSFQLLQEYLEQARRPLGADGGPAARTPFRFRFFLRPAAGARGHEWGGGGSSEDEGEWVVRGGARGGPGAVRVRHVEALRLFSNARMRARSRVGAECCDPHLPPPPRRLRTLVPGPFPAGPQPLARVELTLPPPEPSPAGGGALSAAAKKALGKLLGMCGLEADLAAESEEEAAAKLRLLVFLPEAAEVTLRLGGSALGAVS